MTDQSQGNSRTRLYAELSEAYERFDTELSKATPQWGIQSKRHGGIMRILSPYNVNQVAGIYRGLLVVFFVTGVVLSVVGPPARELGVGLVVGSLFAFGAWMSQAWALSRQEEFTLYSKLLGELYQRDLKLCAAQIVDKTRQLEELNKGGGPGRNGRS
jgi:hypothetical protein